MALEMKTEGSVVAALVAGIALPKMVPIRQRHDASHIPPARIADTVRDALAGCSFRDRVRPGMRVAITGGSRGVANLSTVIRCIANFVKARGAEPFVFPAMGSHGGATAEGQKAILAELDITEETAGCPIVSSMETVEVGRLEDGMPVFADKHAVAADAVILCGRIKAHTAFEGDYESGLCKMAVIGIGKQHGAETVHQRGFRNTAAILPQAGRVMMANVNIVGGVGLVENAYDQTCIVSALSAGEIMTEEPKLLAEAKRRMGRIFFNDLDVLVVDRMGKEISGDGMDPHVTGRFCTPEIMTGKIRVGRLLVLDMTKETRGNCNGLGMADLATKRLIDKIDVDETFPNVVTSTVLVTPKIPLFTHNDRACVQAGVWTCNGADQSNPRIVRIKDTLCLSEMLISTALLGEAEAHPQVDVLGPPEDWGFDAKGNLF